MDDELPDFFAFEPENVSHLDMIAIQLNEMYRSLQRGGFTKEESLELIGIIMSNGLSYAPIQDDNDDFNNGFNEDDGEDFV